MVSGASVKNTFRQGLESSNGPTGWKSKIAHCMAGVNAGCWLDAQLGPLIRTLHVISPAWQSQDVWSSYMEADFPQSEHHRRTRQTFVDFSSLPPYSNGCSHKPAQTQEKGHRSPPLNGAKEYAAIVLKNHILSFSFMSLFFHSPMTPSVPTLGVVVGVSKC